MYVSSLNKYTVKYFLDHFVVRYRKRRRKGANTCALFQGTFVKTLSYTGRAIGAKGGEREVRVKVDQYDDAYQRLTRLVAYEWSLHSKAVSYVRPRERSRGLSLSRRIGPREKKKKEDDSSITFLVKRLVVSRFGPLHPRRLNAPSVFQRIHMRSWYRTNEPTNANDSPFIKFI